MSTSHALLFALLVAGLPLLSMAPEARPVEAAPSQAQLEEYAKLCFTQAVGGEKAAVDRAFEAYGKLLEQQPDQATWHCRYGSLSAMKGRDAVEPEQKVAHVKRGLEAMGKAVALAPDDAGIRFTRASTCAALPPFFHQMDTAIQDCKHLEGLFAKEPAKYPQEFRLQTQVLLAQSLKKAGRIPEAQRVIEQIQAEAPGTVHAQRAQELLK